MKDIAYLIEPMDVNLAGMEHDLKVKRVRLGDIQSHCHSSEVLLRALRPCLSLNQGDDEVDGKEVMNE